MKSPLELLPRRNAAQLMGHGPRAFRSGPVTGIISRVLAVTLLGYALALPAHAEPNWMSVTLDNDLFIGNDSGYTNGIYYSLYEVGEAPGQIPERGFLVAPLIWSLPDYDIKAGVNAYQIGQTMITPSDIKIAIPDENELPYSALLAVTNSYLRIGSGFADRVSTSIGLVGPAALGEEVQKSVHDIVGADEPQGWNTQLKNELVFQFSRARVWRSWVSSSGKFDLLSGAEASFGTIESTLTAGIIWRYGRGLQRSYATVLFNNSRTANPAAIDGGWYLFGGLQAGYSFNQIFADGNTFRDSRSVDYDQELVGIMLGLAYSWADVSLTIAFNDINLLQEGGGEDTLENLTQFGTFTFAWQI